MLKLKLPVIRGLIKRRVLVNFRVDPEVMQRQLPARLRPKLHDGHAIAGICLIRLEHVRPAFMPAVLGLDSENAAHRVAVMWDDDEGRTREGVYIPRRDTASWPVHVTGGRLFPGQTHRASFDIVAGSQRVRLAIRSNDGDMAVDLDGRIDEALPASSGFACLQDASDFFEAGSTGYSECDRQGRLEGMVLSTRTWRMEPLAVDSVYSSYLSEPSRFPAGTVTFDCALLMRDIESEWRSVPELLV